MINSICSPVPEIPARRLTGTPETGAELVELQWPTGRGWINQGVDVVVEPGTSDARGGRTDAWVQYRDLVGVDTPPLEFSCASRLRGIKGGATCSKRAR